MKRDQFISLFFVALLIFVVYQVFLILSPFFKAFFWSGILAFAFYPLYCRLRAFMKNETWSALLMTVLIFLIVVPPVVYILMNISGQAIELYQRASDYVRGGGIERLIEDFRNFGPIKSIQEKVVAWEPLKKSLTDWLLSTARFVGNYTAGQAGNFTKNILLILLNVSLMAFLIFVFLKDGEKIYGFIYQIAPLEERNKRQIAVRINETLAAVLRGQLVTALVQSLMATLIFWVLNVPLALLFGILTFLMSLVPILGAMSVWLPWVIYFFIEHQIAKAVILFLFGSLVISLVDNILKPALIGEKTKLPYFLLLFGILGGIKLYGFLGIFLAPVVLSLFFVLVKIYQENW